MKIQQIKLLLTVFAVLLTNPAHATVCQGINATIVGTPGDDKLVGTRRNNVIDGQGGNDTINDKGGNDKLCGGPGNDTLLGGTGNDKISGGSGADAVKGDGGKDTCKLSPDDKASGCEVRKRDDSSDGSTNGVSGTWYYATGLSAYRYDLSSGRETKIGLAVASGGEIFTEIESEYLGSDTALWSNKVNLRNVGPSPFTLPTIRRTIVGRVQPSPDDQHYIFVFDAALNTIVKTTNYGDPTWSGWVTTV